MHMADNTLHCACSTEMLVCAMSSQMSVIAGTTPTMLQMGHIVLFHFLIHPHMVGYQVYATLQIEETMWCFKGISSHSTQVSSPTTNGKLRKPSMALAAVVFLLGEIVNADTLSDQQDVQISINALVLMRDLQ